MSGVKCGEAMWNDGVVHVKCGCGILSDVEWFDAILDMVRCGMTVEMQCGVVSCGIVRRVVYI